jgi:hypothetical protein
VAAAAAAVKSGALSYREAALRYGINPTKLFRVVKGVQAVDAKIGAPPAIPKVVEDLLAKKLMLLINNHMYLKLVNLPIVAREICIALGIKRHGWTAGAKWQRNFFKRHPELSARVGGKISRARSLHFNELTHAEWYAAIQPLVEFYLASEIFNTDDTGFVQPPPPLHPLSFLGAFLPPSPPPLHRPIPAQCSLDIESSKVKVVGKKGGFQPRIIRSVKDGHICVIMCSPASGKSLQPLFCFAGEKDVRDMAKGTTTEVRWCKTGNGWPDAKALITWGHMVVDHKAKLGLDKMLIFCDNADTHMNIELNALFAQNNIRLFGLIPSSTHATQPLDLNFFGLIKPMLEKLASKDVVTLTPFNVASYWAQAVKELERRRGQNGDSLLSGGFRAAGIVPWNPAKTLEKTKYASAVYAPTEEQKEKARKVGALAGKLEMTEIVKALDEKLMGKITGASLILSPMSEKAKLERIELAGKKRKAGPAVPEPTDEKLRPQYFLEQHSYTSESRARKMAAIQKAKEEEEVAKAAKKAADANKKQKKVEDEEKAAKDRAEKKKEIQERKAMVDAEKKARAQAKEAAKAAKAAKAAARVLRMKKPAQRKLKAAPEEQAFGPPKNKRAKKM